FDREHWCPCCRTAYRGPRICSFTIRIANTCRRGCAASSTSCSTGFARARTWCRIHKSLSRLIFVLDSPVVVGFAKSCSCSLSPQVRQNRARSKTTQSSSPTVKTVYRGKGRKRAPCSPATNPHMGAQQHSPGSGQVHCKIGERAVVQGTF